MTYRELLRNGERRLLEEGIPDWRQDAWYLLEETCRIDRARYLADGGQAVPAQEELRYLELIGKRAAHVPLQYLTGTQVFMGYPFYVNEAVLIPRQDTEILVEETMKYIRPGMHILDMCTGSGCILLSLLKMNPGCTGVGAELSEAALLVAERNREALGVQATLVRSDLFSQVSGRYDCIVSNPPYIPSGEIEGLMEEVREHEPRMALDGAADGLYYYRRITEQSPGFLKPGGRLLFEIGCDQAEAVCALMERSFTGIRVTKDLAGLDRVVSGALCPQPDRG